MNAYFDRFDVCEAYLIFERDYHVGGWLRERASNRRRHEATDVQLHRMGFRPAPGLGGYRDLTANGRAIYRGLAERYGFRKVKPAPVRQLSKAA